MLLSLLSLFSIPTRYVKTPRQMSGEIDKIYRSYPHPSSPCPPSPRYPRLSQEDFVATRLHYNQQENGHQTGRQKIQTCFDAVLSAGYFAVLSAGLSFLNLIRSAPVRRERADEGRCIGRGLCGFSLSDKVRRAVCLATSPAPL